ncbi:hypothetical protein CTAYLR_000458 [Chrysophaeum taylorii]|uniref:Uncharacterized protein n=1 Tax=Chrysophaeum taylorii TaxID=2483200 RepID=A0AAD7XJX0_9STRA|nr:hypothetical protein CTAYLR_000458 [Chrysophaeum taylorii]
MARVWSATLEEGTGAEAEDTYEECDERRSAIVSRLRCIELPSAMEKWATPEKVETHRDILLKEMAWMAADFETERKRHAALRKKRCKAILGHFRNMEGRRKRVEREREIAMRKLAGKVSKLVKTFWFKIDKVITYKQRLEWQAEQRKAMDRHLVHLVRQTERYTGELASKLATKKDVAEHLEAIDACARETDVPRPYLLDSKLSLRPYQHVGLNWLASMHARRLNGILADEMGLGKTVQAIALLAHLACARGIWGPHLVVAPTSCLVNWEAELKKFCPGLKIVTYYGSAKARKQLRTGWSKAGALHVCVTSYQLAVQDASVFRRKKFYYLILDEAHNIKNFESRRWRTLLAFQAQRRLLLTGTPLQNSLMELWSLMHFLMPHLFRSRQEFSYWFSNPLSSAVEGRSRLSDELVKRLHSIMRPFVLRRLKKDVAKQLPAKHEHEISCKLSRRQQLLYEEFMSRSSTRKALARESNVNFVSMMNVIMQLRKVCNHPDLFEPRPVVAPFVFAPGLVVEVPRLAIGGGPAAPRWLRVEENDRVFVVETAPSAPLDLVKGPALFVEDLHNSAYDQLRVRLDDEATDSLARFHERETTLGVHGAVSRLSRRTVRLVTSMLADEPFRVAKLAAAAFAEGSSSEAALARNRARRRASNVLVEMLEASGVARRAAELAPVFKRFVCVVPRAVAHPTTLCVRHLKRHDADVNTKYPFGLARRVAVAIGREASRHLRAVELALSVNFPDRSLVQWDSGKFHKLAPLLRDLKRHNHRCLIFTQMSRMLDVLEAFLCFHGHSYSRLDGATAPDERQRRVERFNTDESLFCMVLSTRSGGLGINLTGADVVIFYDSDWNPAMDAQATDRAHRIGQTREVHIYRLVCAATVEENILVKAKQKRKLEFVALTEGQFDAAGILARVVESQDVANLAVQVEDAEDVESANKAQQEAANEAAEFSETGGAADESNNNGQNNNRDNDGDDAAVDETAKLEAEFAAWQERVGPDPDKLADALKPVERRCLEIVMRNAAHAETTTTNGSSAFMTAAERKLWDEMAAANRDDNNNNNFDVDAVEEEKMAEERKACVEGDILVSDVYFDASAASTYERAFKRRRRQMHSEAARRKCTGAAWERRQDANTGEPFWYNVDTEEATWRTPAVIARRDAEIDARRGGYARLAAEIAVRVLAGLAHVERARAAAACRRWSRASRDDCFVTTVLPVERVALAESGPRHLAATRRRRGREVTDDTLLPDDLLLLAPTRTSLRAAIDAAAPGETLALGAGHYWEDADDLLVDKAIRILGDQEEPARCVVELGGALRWRATSGALVGLTLRRPRASRAATAAVVVEHAGRLCAARVCVDNEGAGGAAFVVATHAFAYLSRCRVSGAKASALLVAGAAAIDRCALVQNKGAGLFLLHQSAAVVADSWLGPNDAASVYALADSRLALDHCDCGGAPLKLEDSAFVVSTATLGVRDTSWTINDLVLKAENHDDHLSSKKRALDQVNSLITEGVAYDDADDVAGPPGDAGSDRDSPQRARQRRRRRHTKPPQSPFAPNGSEPTPDRNLALAFVEDS